MGVILDTNGLTAIADGDSGATKRFLRADEVAIPVIVLGEYRFGISQSRHRQEYERWLSEMVAACRVLLLDENTASRYASVRIQLKRAGTPIPSNDTWIAALCLQHALPLLSRDRHFDLVKGIERIGW
jgi:tRNA(fMet)-specific endonuclease VapC